MAGYQRVAELLNRARDVTNERVGDISAGFGREFRPFDQSVPSLAQHIADTVTDTMHSIRAAGYTGQQFPLHTFLRPRSPGAEEARKSIWELWDELERQVAEEPDPVKALYGLLLVNQGRQHATRLRRDYALSAKYAREMMVTDTATGNPIPLPDREVLRVAESWFTESRTVLEAVKRALESYKPNITVALDPTGQELVQRNANHLRTYIANRQQMAEKFRRLAEEDALRMAGIHFDPNDPATIKAGVNQLASVSPDLKDTLDDAIDLIYADRDRDVLYMGRVTEDVVERNILPFTHPAVSSLRDLLEPEAAHTLLSTQRDLERQALGLREFMGTLPVEQAALGQQYEGIYSRLVSQVGADRARVAKALLNIKGMPKDVKSLDDVVEYLTQMGVMRRPAPGEPQLVGLRLVEDLARHPDLLDPQDYLTLKNAVSRWASRGDLLVDDPLLLVRDKFQDVVRRQLEAKERPLGQSARLPGLGEQLSGALRTASQVWKENVLAAPATSLLNFISGHIFNALAGHLDVRRTIQAQSESFKNIIADPTTPGPHWYAQETQEFLQRLGLKDVTQSLGASLTNTILESLAGNERTATERVPAWLRAMIGGAIGSGAGPAGALVGGLQGLVAPTQVRFFRIVNRAIETGTRTMIWQDVMSNELARRVDQFAEEAARTLLEPKQRLGQQVIQADPQAVDDLVNWLRSTQGQFSVAELDSRLHLASKGLQPQEAQRLVRDWAEHQLEASKAGVKEAHRIHFDYSHMNNLEEWLRQFIPFHKWAVGAIPFYAQRLSEHPALAIMLARLFSGSEKEKEELGLGVRFENSVGVSGAEWLAQLILGRPGELRVNPSNLLFPFANLSGGVERASRESNPLAAGLDILSSLGFGLSPLAVAPLTAVGALGPDQPLPNLNRLSPLYGLLPGAEAPAESNWQSVVNAITNRQAFEPHRYNTQKRLADRSVEEQGIPIEQNPNLLGALVDSSHPAYTQASEEVLGARGRQSLLNLIFPLSAQTLSEAEKTISKERTYYPEGPIDTEAERAAYQQAVKDHPLGTGYSPVRGDPREAELQRGLQVLSHPAALFPDAPPAFLQHLDALWKVYSEADPKTQAFLRRHQPALGLLGQRQREFIQSSPILQQYLLWSKLHPGPRQEGEAPREAQFFNWFTVINQGV